MHGPGSGPVAGCSTFSSDLSARRPAFSAYSTNYLIDAGHCVIMDVEPTPAHRTGKGREPQEHDQAGSTTIRYSRIGSSAIPLMEPHRCWPRWSTKRTSSHLCRFETKPSARTTASQSAIFNGMKIRRSIGAPPDARCVASGGPSKPPLTCHESRHYRLNDTGITRVIQEF